jgi:hypothetical protein
MTLDKFLLWIMYDQGKPEYVSECRWFVMLLYYGKHYQNNNAHSFLKDWVKNNG